MADYRTTFENNYPGAEALTQSCLDPVFGPIQKAKRSLNDSLSGADKTIVKDIFIFGSSNNFSFGEMNFFDVTLNGNVNIERNRVTVQRAVRRGLDSYQAAIVIFHREDNRGLWRFSFINRGDGNTMPAKRYSYLCGKGRFCRILADNLGKLQNISGKKGLADVTDVFSIEALTEEFFKRLFKWYDTWAVDIVRFPVGSGKNVHLSKTLDESMKKENRQHLIRLVTRIIFIWFIKHKENLIPDWIFGVEELKKIIHNFDEHDDKNGSYYNAVLQNLFFATLNCEIRWRKFFDGEDGRDSYGIKTQFQDHIDKPMINIPHKEFIKKFETVPFLNGGLFECLDRREEHKEQEYKDGFSRESKRAAFVPNCLFFGDNISGGHEGLIDIFSQYNFTIEENIPQDIEIALDPELLGKVFENLLGTYNEETASTARNESGSFYTPREIVEYMVDSSLKEYFTGKLQTQEPEIGQQLDTLFSLSVETHNFSNDQAAALVESIYNCKILDPACGSGAFPMGILNKLVFILEKLDPENIQWKEIQIRMATKDIEKAYRAGAEKERKERLKKIQEVFEQSTGQYANYARKLYLIENCIYGVDIQPIAIQISKLRFFISLVVDQKTGGTIDNNYNILPLPNLETKFVAANTLIGIKREQGIFADPKIEETQAKLLEIRHRYFNPRTVKEKDKLREKDIKLTRALLDLLKEDGFYNATDAAQMAEWNPYNQTKPSDFFDAWWMFGIKDGFDVVIGNPPYVDSEHMIIIDESLRDRYKGIYKSAIGNWDLFVIFIEKSILLANIYGVIVLITPNKLISQDYASVIRNMIIAGLLEIRDYSRLDVFENTAVYPITILIKKKDQNQPVNVISMSTVNSIKGANKIDRRELQILPWDVFFWDFSRLLILRKINNCSKSLGDLIKFENPCTVSEAYEIKEILLDKNLTNNAKKFINSGTIDPYLSWWSVKNTVYIRDKYKYPIVTDRGLKKISARRFMQAQSKKIIVANMTLKIEAFLDINAEYLAGKSTIIAVGNADELNIGVALLNSKLVSFWYKCMYHSTKMAGEALSITTKRLSKAPVPEISGDSKKSLLKYVKSLLNKKNKDSLIDTSALERQIDNLVYRLYNLTWEEVRVIEPEFPLSKAEYEGTQRINSTPMRYISMARQTKSIR